MEMKENVKVEVHRLNKKKGPGQLMVGTSNWDQFLSWKWPAKYIKFHISEKNNNRSLFPLQKIHNFAAEIYL